MGQKVSPTGFRTGITKTWQSRWYAPKASFGEFLVEDKKIRDFLDRRLNRNMPYAAISRVEIERTREEVKLTIHTARPGVVIGARGAEIDKLKGELESLTNRLLNVNVVEVRKPDLDAQLVADGIAQQLRRRSSYRRTMRQRCETAMSAGALGIKIICSGRLSGAEIARSEAQMLGSIPLHTLKADVDYAVAVSRTTYGAIGVKVWIYKGLFPDVQETA
ncbi:MAG: 30S ribosomal protein S3 [Actinobacteria bacterium]|nr:30S ribosomal protein S3 [Actinomycetota bacterium]